MQEKKRRSKRGFLLLVSMVALAIMAFVPAFASAAPHRLTTGLDMTAGPNGDGVWGQGPMVWFGDTFLDPGGQFRVAYDGTFLINLSNPTRAHFLGNIHSIMYSVDGASAQEILNPNIPFLPLNVDFSDHFDHTAAPGIHTVLSWVEETTETVINPDGSFDPYYTLNAAPYTEKYGVDYTAPDWQHVVNLLPDFYGQGPEPVASKAADPSDDYYSVWWNLDKVDFSAIVSDQSGSGADYGNADVEGNTTNPTFFYGAPLGWDEFTFAVTGTVDSPTSGMGWMPVTKGVQLLSDDMVGNEANSWWHVNFDRRAPHTTASVDPLGSDSNSGWTNKPVTVTFHAGDSAPTPNSGVAYTEYIVKTSDTVGPPATPALSATGTHGTSVVIDTTAPIGPSYVFYRSVDKAVPSPNVEDWDMIMVFFDNVAPAMSDDTPTWWINKFPFLSLMDEAFISITASDHNSGLANPGIKWTVDGHPGAFGSGIGPVVEVPILPLALGDGIRALTYTATDKAGNTTTGGNQIKIDTRGPVTEALVPSVGTAKWVNGLVPYVLLATDQVPGAGVAATVYRVNQSTPWSINAAATVAPTLETPITLPGVQNDMFTIDFASVDAALPFWFDADEWAAMTTAPKWHLGNWELDILNILKTGAAYKSLTVKLDVTAPVVALANPVNPDWQKGPATINFTGTDVGAGYDYTEWSTDGGTTWTKGEVAQIGGNGVVEVMYRGVDKVGIKSATQTTSVSVATTGPKNAAKNASVVKGKKATFTFKVTAVTPKASVNILIRKNGHTLMLKRYSQVTTNAWVTRSFNVNLPKGTYLIRVDSVDLVGNTQTVRGQANLTVK